MDCSEFLQDYSSYRDGLAPAGRAAAFETHLRECDTCARYDRVIGGGVELVQKLEPVEPSYDFMARLQHRIYHVEEEMRASRRVSSWTSVAFTVAIVATIGVSAWLPATRRPVPAVVVLPPVLAQAPPRVESVPSLFRSGPLLLQSGGATQGARADNALFFRYSPLGAAAGDPVPAILTAQSVRQH